MGGSPIELVLACFLDARKNGKGWIARCPAHEDRTASLSIGVGDDHRVLLHCFAKCAPEDIVAAKGLTMADLFPAPPRSPEAQSRRTPSKGSAIFPTRDAAIDALLRSPKLRGAKTTGFEYHNRDESVSFCAVRFDLSNGTGKEFRIIRPVGAGWAVGAPPGKLPLFGLLELAAAATVYVPEGEKCVLAARALGLTATTSAIGAGNAARTDWTPLRGKSVIILRDNDDAGRKYADAVAGILMPLGCRVKIVLLPDVPEHGDIVDWLAAHDSRETEDLLATIEQLAAEAPIVEPAVPRATPAKLAWRPFPIRVLPESLRHFVEEGAASMRIDPTFFALPVLAVTASAIGTTRRIRIKQDWHEPAVLWSATVAPSGRIKSPPLRAATEPLQELDDEVYEAYEAAVKRFEAEEAAYSVAIKEWRRSGQKNGESPPKKPAEPVCQRFVVQDVTIEALAVVLKSNPRGVLLCRDELAAWVRAFDKYNKKNAAEIAHWIEIHAAQTVKIDRKTGIPPHIRIRNAAVSVTGTIQPRTLARVLTPEFFETGFAARLLLAMPPNRKKTWSDAVISDGASARYAATVRRLTELAHRVSRFGRPLPIDVPLSHEARIAWIGFFEDFAEKQHTTRDEDLAAAYSKLEGAAARFGLVFHLVRLSEENALGAETPPISAKAIEAGVTLARWFVDETERVYAELRSSAGARELSELEQHVRTLGGSATARDLMRTGPCFPTAKEAQDALQRLVEAGRATSRWETRAEGGKPQQVYTLTPADPDPADDTPAGDA